MNKFFCLFLAIFFIFLNGCSLINFDKEESTNNQQVSEETQEKEEQETNSPPIPEKSDKENTPTPEFVFFAFDKTTCQEYLNISITQTSQTKTHISSLYILHFSYTADREIWASDSSQVLAYKPSSVTYVKSRYSVTTTFSVNISSKQTYYTFTPCTVYFKIKNSFYDANLNSFGRLSTNIKFTEEVVSRYGYVEPYDTTPKNFIYGINSIISYYIYK